MNKIVYLLLTFLIITSCSGKSVKVTVTNPSSLAREGELIEIPKENVNTKLRIYDDKTIVVLNEAGEQIPYQITYEGMILFPTKVAAKGKATYTIQEGTPIKVETSCYGAKYPKRLDDLAWENDRIGWRAYGPAAQKRGDNIYGYDLWNKRVNYPILDKLYEMDRVLNEKKAQLSKEGKRMSAEEEETMSYHVDHGEGCDYYTVGPTLGAGTAAFYSDATGEFIFPYCWKTCDILDAGPLRFTARLTYDITVNEVRVLETRLISLDKGSQFTKETVWYTNIFTTTPLACGIAMHQGGQVLAKNTDEGYVAYADPENPKNGTTYLGLVFPNPIDETKEVPLAETQKQAAKTNPATIGHLIGLTQYSPKDRMVYYFGAGWSKWGFKTAGEWSTYVKDFAQKTRSPLIVKWK
ncbi:MAG: DUF4861 family protein [Bacteroidaceae bacterium]